MSALSDTRRVHLGNQIAYAACLVALPALLAVFVYLRPPGRSVSAHDLAQVKQRAVTLASTLYGPTRVVGVPQHLPNACWQVSCQSGAMRFEMLLDDSGRLWRLQTVGSPQGSANTMAPLRTAAQARQVALHRLKDLRVVASTSRLRVVEAPILSASLPKGSASPSTAWRMAWWVQPADRSPLYKVALELDRNTGVPLSITRDVGLHTGRRLEE